MSELEPRREHLRKKQRNRASYRHKRSIWVFAIFGIVDVLLIALTLWLEQLWPMAVRYALAVLAATLAQPRSYKEPWTSRQALISLTAVLIPTGGLIAAYWSLRFHQPSGSWLDLPTSTEPYRSAIDWQGVLDVVPLIDVLDSEDASYKKQVLLQTQAMKGRVEVSVVRKALDDPDPEVRYYAASILSYTEAAHTGAIRRLEEQIRRSPDQAPLWLELATAYEAVLAAGLSGDELSRFYQEKKLAALERSLQIDPEQPDAGIERARTLAALGRHEEAAVAARQWLSHEEYADRVRVVLIQIAFAKNDQRELEALAREIRDISLLPQGVRGVVEMVRAGEVAR